ncbi:Sgm1 [Kluyveromyces lactis]|nr:Sgm1 [Kluyveromyces lactis]
MEKLSVQERLSLATKAKAKARKKNKKLSSPEVVESSVDTIENIIDSDIPKEVEIGDTTADVKGAEAIPEDDTKDTNAAVEYFNSLLHLNESVLQLDPANLLRQLYPIVQKYQQNSIDSSSKQSYSNSDSSLIRLIKEKDEKIDSLLKEGETLSKKELQQSDKIKKLNKTIKDLESDFGLKLDELQDVKTQADVLETTNESLMVSLKEMEKRLNTLNKKYEDLKKEYDEHLNTEYESKKVELKKLVEENDVLKNELSQIREHGDQMQRTFESKYKTLEETSKEEVDRLEIRLEQLRIDLENVNTKSGDLAATDNTTNDAYSKLLSQYKATQHELNESNRNWASIEYALNEKCDSLKSAKVEADQIIESLSTELNGLKQSRDEILLKLNKLTAMNGELQSTLKETTDDLLVTKEKLSDISDDYEILQKQHDIQKVQLGKALGNQLTEKKTALKENEGLDQVILDTTKISDSTQEHPLTKWDLNHEKMDQLDPLVDENLDDDLKADFSFEKDIDIPDEAADLELLKRGSSDLSLAMNSTYVKANTARDTQSGVNNTNLQMVTRLGGEIRRLETELSSVREAYTRLMTEKEQANEEISRLLESNEEVILLKRDRDTLSKDLQKLQAKQSTILELLGEKTERVEELENDVVDLKDLMRTQVQQIVQLQEQLR